MRTVRQGPGGLLGLGVLVLLGALLLTLPPRTTQADRLISHPLSGGRVPPTPVPFQTGDLVVATGGGAVYHYRPDGTFVRALNTHSTGTYQTGMCFDAQGRLYTTNWSSGEMTQFDLLGQLLAYPWGGPFDTSPESCAVDAAGHIYVGQAPGVNHLRKFDATGNLLTTYTPQLGGVARIDLAPDQCTIYYSAQGFAIMRFDVCTTTQLPNFTQTNTQNLGLRILPNGEVLSGTTIGIYHLSAAGTVLNIYRNSTYNETGFVVALALDPDGTTFWAAWDDVRGRVHRINIATGADEFFFDSHPVAGTLGLVVYGEHEAGGGTPTPSPTIPPPSGTATATATPPPPTATATLVRPTSTPTRTRTATPLPPKTTPTPTPPGTSCPAQTPTRLPTPANTPATGCTATPRRGELQASITDRPTTTEALFTNRSTTCSYRIGVAAYEKHDGMIEHQELYDYTLAVIPPNSMLVLTVNNPSCAYQADAFWGDLLESFAGGGRYNERRLDDTDGHGHDYCPAHCPPTAVPLTGGDPPR